MSQSNAGYHDDTPHSASTPTDVTRPHDAPADPTRPYDTPADASRPGEHQDPERAEDLAGSARVERPTGVSWPTVVFGSIAVAVGTLVLLVQTVGLDIAWSVVVPATVVVIGAVLIVLGVIGLFTRREQDAP